MRAFHFAVLAAGLLATPLPAAPAATQAPPRPAADAAPLEHPVRVIFVNTPLRQALQYLFRGRPGDCLVAVDVPDVPVRAQLSASTLDEAVGALLKAASAVDPELTLARAQNRYLLSNAHPYHPEDALFGSVPKYSALVEISGHGEEELVTADFRDMPVRDVIGAAMTGSGLQYTVDPNVPNLPITLNIRDIRLPAMLRLIVRQAAASIPGLELTKQDEVYVVSIKPVSPPAAALPAQPGGAVLERKITLDIRDMPLRDVLALLFKGSGLQYSIDPNVPNVPITLNIRDITLPAALRLIIRQAAIAVPGLTVGKEGDIYLIRMRAFPAAFVKPPARSPRTHTGYSGWSVATYFTPAPAEEAPRPYAPRQISLDFQRVRLRQALARLFEGSGQQYVVDPAVPDVRVTLTVEDRPWPIALRLLIRQAARRVRGLTCGKEGDIYQIIRRVPESTRLQLLSFAPEEPASETFTYNLYEIPLREAVRLLFQGTGQKYLVASDVPDVPITLNIRDIQRAAALRLMVRQAAVQVPGLTSTNEGGVYLVQRRAPAVAEEVPPPGEAPPDQLASDQGLTWEKIPIQFVNVGSLAMLFGGSVIPAPNGGPSTDGELSESPAPDTDQYEAGGVGGLVPPGITSLLGCPRDNSLMVRGTPDDIQTLKNVIRLLDIPQRQFVLRLSTGTVSAEGRAGNNARLTLGDATHDRSFRFTAIPRFNGDGTIDISVEGTLNLHGTPHPLATHVSVAAGEAVTLFTLGEGLGATRIWLRASIAPQPLNKGDDPS